MRFNLLPQKPLFYETKGIKLFRELSVADKNEHLVNISFHHKQNDKFTMIAKNIKNEKMGYFNLEFDKQNSILKSDELFVSQEDKNIGQLLTLSSLIEFTQNRLNRFNVFVIEEAMPFLAKYGFVIENDDPKYIQNGLREVMSSRLRGVNDCKSRAEFFNKKMKNYKEELQDDKYLFYNSCKVISDYMRLLSRNKLEKYYPIMHNGSNMRFTTWEILTNKDYLNPLYKKHKIDYQL